MSCPAGASVKPGLDPATQVLVDRSLWETVTGTPSSWLDPFLEIFQWNSIPASDLCALNLSDPPLPTVTQILDALTGFPSSIALIRDYIRDKLRYVAFANSCVCNAGGAPSCSYYYGDANAWPNTDTNSTLTTQGVRFQALQAVYMDTVKIWVYGPYPRSIKCSLWDQTTHVRVWTETFSVASFTDVQHAVTAPPLLVAGRNYILGKLESAGQSFPATYAGAGTPSDARGSMGAGCNNGGGDLEPTNTQSGVAYGIQPVLCDTSTAPVPPAAPTVPTQPPTLVIPPDWSCATACDIMTRLQQLADSLTWLRRDVTIIQRQGVPFGYFLGTAHSALTGSGSFAVSDILGLLVSVSTWPARWGRSGDNPQRFIPAPAVVVAGTSDGDQDTHFVHFTSELWFPPAAGAMSKITYQFKPGCAGAITEIRKLP